MVMTFSWGLKLLMSQGNQDNEAIILICWMLVMSQILGKYFTYNYYSLSDCSNLFLSRMRVRDHCYTNVSGGKPELKMVGLQPSPFYCSGIDLHQYPLASIGTQKWGFGGGQECPWWLPAGKKWESPLSLSFRIWSFFICKCLPNFSPTSRMESWVIGVDNLSSKLLFK